MASKKRQKVIDYLRDKGCSEVPCRSGKYRQFKRANQTDDKYYFVSRNGALRMGTSASNSISITAYVDKILAKLKEVK